VQIYHNNWDTHGNVAGRLPDQCRDVDQPCYGLVQDLKNLSGNKEVSDTVRKLALKSFKSKTETAKK